VCSAGSRASAHPDDAIVRGAGFGGWGGWGGEGAVAAGDVGEGTCGEAPIHM